MDVFKKPILKIVRQLGFLCHILSEISNKIIFLKFVIQICQVNKMNKTHCFYLIIFILIMTACKEQKPLDYSGSIQEIQQKSIVDKRLEYWKVETETEGGKIYLRGATVSATAHKQLQEYAKKEGIDFKVELLPSEDFREDPWGIVTLSVCNIRGNGRHSAELVTQALMGTPVKVYQKVHGWYLIQTPDRYFGWVDGAGIATKTNAEMARWKALEKVLYKNQYGFAYAKANEKSGVETDLVLADLLSVIGIENDFYKVLLPDGREVFVKKGECTSLDIWTQKTVKVEDVLATAFNFKGVPYLWGGTSAKMVDCSGFTKTAYYMHGLILQRDASQQTLYGQLVDTENGYDGLQRGDLVFFGRKASNEQNEKVTHVGICIGNSEFIHASGKVRINSLDRQAENYTEYYEHAFVRARRIVGHVGSAGIEWVVENNFYKEILP